MVTKDKKSERGFRNKFGMTRLKCVMTRLKFGMPLLVVLFLTSCSFYEDLRGNPVFKEGAVCYPQNISVIYGDQSTGCITLIWDLVENASAYEIYRIKSSGTNGFSNNYLDSNASMIYKYSIPYSKGKNAVLEISNISSGQNFFFIKSVSEKSSKSDYSKKYAYFYSYYSSNENLAFREISDFGYEFDATEVTGVIGKSFTIKYSDVWSSAEFALEDDWASIEIQFAAGSSLENFQIVLVSDAFERQESWGPEYYSEYIELSSPSITIKFDEWLNKSLKSKGATKIVSANIANSSYTSNLSVKVVWAIVTKKDGSQIAVVPKGDWGSEVDLN